MSAIVIYIISVALQFVFVRLFLKHSWPERTHTSLKMKMICSGLFLISAVCCTVYSNNTSSYMKYLMLALVFGVIGDLLIHIIAPPTVNFLGGVSFFIGHIFFVIAFSYAHSGFVLFSASAFIPVAVIMAIACAVAIKIHLELGKLVLPVFCYGSLICFMLISAVRLGILLLSDPDFSNLGAFLTLVIGAVCFVISDSSLAIYMFGGQRKNKALKIFYIVTYYVAQVLLGTSLIFIK